MLWLLPTINKISGPGNALEHARQNRNTRRTFLEAALIARCIDKAPDKLDEFNIEMFNLALETVPQRGADGRIRFSPEDAGLFAWEVTKVRATNAPWSKLELILRDLEALIPSEIPDNKGRLNPKLVLNVAIGISLARQAKYEEAVAILTLQRDELQSQMNKEATRVLTLHLMPNIVDIYQKAGSLAESEKAISMWQSLLSSPQKSSLDEGSIHRANRAFAEFAGIPSNGPSPVQPTLSELLDELIGSNPIEVNLQRLESALSDADVMFAEPTTKFPSPYPMDESTNSLERAFQILAKPYPSPSWLPKSVENYVRWECGPGTERIISREGDTVQKTIPLFDLALLEFRLENWNAAMEAAEKCVSDDFHRDVLSFESEVQYLPDQRPAFLENKMSKPEARAIIHGINAAAEAHVGNMDASATSLQLMQQALLKSPSKEWSGRLREFAREVELSIEKAKPQPQ